MSKIEWTERTWNPIVGCAIVSPGCKNCYAMRMAARLAAMGQERYAGLTQPSKAGPVWTGQTRLVEEALTLPLRTRKPTMWFVNSMSDLFADTVTDAEIDRVFAVMALTPEHTYQILTKRSGRMRRYMAGCAAPPHDLPLREPWVTQWHRRDGVAAAMREIGRAFPDRLGKVRRLPLPNVWLGVSTEDQPRADERVPDLLATPAAVRFVSAEPLLGPIDYKRLFVTNHHGGAGRYNALTGEWRPGDLADLAQGRGPRLDWVIVGGESGHGARPMHPEWPRRIRDACLEAGVAFLFKQWGAWLPGQNDPYDGFGDGRSVAHWQDGAWGVRSTPNPAKNYVTWEPDGTLHHGERSGGYWPIAAWASRVGKKGAGRRLDGVEYNGMPAPRAIEEASAHAA